MSRCLPRSSKITWEVNIASLIRKKPPYGSAAFTVTYSNLTTILTSTDDVQRYWIMDCFANVRTIAICCQHVTVSLGSLYCYRNSGFQWYIKDMFDCPEPVMRYLCLQYAVHQVRYVFKSQICLNSSKRFFESFNKMLASHEIVWDLLSICSWM